MPKSCAKFKLLQQRLDYLTNKFVIHQVAAEAAAPGIYQPDLDNLAAYRLLMHAEIEDFLEEKAKENLDRLATQISTGTWCRQFPELIALAIALKKPLPAVDALDPAKFGNFVLELIASARTAISANNGIKASAFQLLSICAGKTVDEIDTFLSASLNSYGKDRGDVAHRSVTHSTTLQAPSSELAAAQSLVAQVAKYFDVCP